MSSIISLAAAAILGFSQLTSAQTNITASACAASSIYSSCNRDVADKWSSCISGCNGDGNCSVDCGCTAHQEYINCMAHSCWNKVCSSRENLQARCTVPSTMTQSLTRIPPYRSTHANINSSCNNTLLSALVPLSQFPSGLPQKMHQVAAPVIWARCSRTRYQRARRKYPAS